MAQSAYKRILLKVSGEALSGDQSFGINPAFLDKIAAQIAEVARAGVAVAIVTGGGNIFRGMSVAAEGGDRVTADMMGTLGTIPLLYLLVFGQRIANVKSWIRFGSFQFQPAELAKISTALLVAYLFENEDDGRLRLSAFLKVGAIVIVLTWAVTWYYVNWCNRHIDDAVQNLQGKRK